MKANNGEFSVNERLVLSLSLPMAPLNERKRLVNSTRLSTLSEKKKEDNCCRLKYAKTWHGGFMGEGELGICRGMR